MQLKTVSQPESSRKSEAAFYFISFLKTDTCQCSLQRFKENGESGSLSGTRLWSVDGCDKCEIAQREEKNELMPAREKNRKKEKSPHDSLSSRSTQDAI